ncbi:MAG: hypothetical protein ABL870_12245, partial [Sediminibacterium sp.]
PWIGIPIFLLGLVLLDDHQQICINFQKLNTEEAQLIGDISESDLIDYNTNLDLLNATTEMAIIKAKSEVSFEQKLAATKEVFFSASLPSSTTRVARLILSRGDIR